MEKEFDLEHQYQLYLQRVNVNESNMSEVQRKEMRQCFMGACGQMLFLFCADLTKLSEQDAFKVLDNMKKQIGDYFNKINERQN